MKTGVVFTGGGLKGICAQTGALLALEPLNLKFEAAIGTSAGAIVSSMFTSGRTPTEMRDTFTALTKDDYLDPLFDLELAVTNVELVQQLRDKLKGETGFYRGDAFLAFLKEKLGQDRIEQCSPKLYLTLTNISRAIAEVWSEGPLPEAARASAAIPVVFGAQKITDIDRDPPVIDEYFVDGGAVNNVPVDELERREPEIEQFLVLTTLGLDRTAPKDNGFLEQSWTPLRVLGPAIDAIATDQHLQNLEIGEGKRIIPFKIEIDAIDLDEPEKIGERIEQGRLNALETIQRLEDELASIPRKT